MGNEVKTYQTHDEDTLGMSDSAHKLRRLHLPMDLQGKSVLDIGCNEGYFCARAKERGAKTVIGIDFEAARIEFAIARYGSLGIDFRRQTWQTLPEGKFDLIIWSSAMHYERDPRFVLSAIRDRLRPDGQLILECGVFHSPEKEMKRVNRHSDTRFYPTIPYLRDVLLRDFSVRTVSDPEIVPGDPVPRQVFHCSRTVPTVLLVLGESGRGKTSLANRFLSQQASKVYSIDAIVSQIGQSQFSHSEFDSIVKSAYDPSDLMRIHDAISRAELDDTFAEVLAEHVVGSDELVVFEGFLKPAVVGRLTSRLGERCRVWSVKPER